MGTYFVLEKTRKSEEVDIMDMVEKEKCKKEVNLRVLSVELAFTRVNIKCVCYA